MNIQTDFERVISIVTYLAEKPRNILEMCDTFCTTQRTMMRNLDNLEKSGFSFRRKNWRKGRRKTHQIIGASDALKQQIKTLNETIH